MTESSERRELEVKYNLKLVGNGVTVEREISESVARDIVSLVMGGGPESAPGGRRSAAHGGAAVVDPSNRKSVREYIDGAGAKRNPDKITAIAGYLKSHEQETFTRDGIKDQFPKAGESVPANFPRDFSLAVSTGWIAEDPANAGAFYITSTGEKAIIDGFAGKIRRPRRKARKIAENDDS